MAVLALIGVAAWLVRRFATNRLGANTNRGRMPRLAVIDAAAVDGRRRLVLVRRDNIEHLLMIGGPTDIVVEPNIVRAMPARDQMRAAPAVGGAEPPPRIAPLPDTSWSEAEGARADMFDHAEPQMPEPPPRPARPSFADEVRRPAPPPMPERRAEPAERTDPLAGFAPEPLGELGPSRAPNCGPNRCRRDVTSRSEPMMPRPPRPSEPPKAPPRPRAERAAAPPPPPRRRLRRRRRPLPAPTRISPRWRSGWKPPCAVRPATNRRRRRCARTAAAAPPPRSEPMRRRRRRAPPPKTGFENLEDEMASLLGRPKNPS